MLTHRTKIMLLVASALTTMTLMAGPVLGQTPVLKALDWQQEVLAAQRSRITIEGEGTATTTPGKKAAIAKPTPVTKIDVATATVGPDEKVVVEPVNPGQSTNDVANHDAKSDDLKGEVAAVKAENAAVKEILRKMEEQQKVLLEQVDRLQQRLDGSQVPKQLAMDDTADTPDAQPAVAKSKVAAGKAADETDRYRDGMIIWETGEEARVPFLLKFNINTQFRYLNTLNSDETFTDHLGNVREVHRRNDLTVNRAMFILGGYVFDKRLRYSFTVWTSAGSASIVVAGNIGWQFNKHLTLTAGYTGVPGSRSLINTFPFFANTDRTMADNFFRPAFTQGLWASGEVVKGLKYIAFVGNGLNTLNISANKIDTNLLLSGSVWWEPLGDYGEPGKSRDMYDDYFSKDKVRIRLGTSFTRSREDRFSNLDVTNPDNTALHNSDGVLTFATGAFAPGVTVEKATYRMWAIDAGMKWKGFAINTQYYMRWLDDFEADGPLPLDSTFDHGFDLVAGHFVVPKKLMVYGRGSMVFGEFNNSYEYAGGAKWHFLPTERLWLSAEMMRVHRAPYGGTFTPYTAGLSGWVPMVQTVLAF
jgi:hypothetical protein